jgi:YVTN family beta-propeller protein
LSTNVSVIDAVNNVLITNVMTMDRPIHVAITPNDAEVYVANYFGSTVSVIDGTSNALLVPMIGVGLNPQFIAISPDGSNAYVCNYDDASVSVINTTSHLVTHTLMLPPFSNPYWISITPDGSKGYVVNQGDNSVSVINTAANTINPMAIPVGMSPSQSAITADGSKLYVVHFASPFVSVISTASDSLLPNIVMPGNPSWVVVSPGQFLDVSGYQTINQFLTQKNRLNVITWLAPATNSVIVQYLVYRNAALTDFAGAVPASGPLKFIDYNVLKNKAYTYYIISQDEAGDTSLPSIITIGS